MPTYRFVCPRCEHEDEVKVAVERRDQVKPPCPECKALMERRFAHPMAVTWAGRFHDRAMQKENLDGLGSEW